MSTAGMISMAVILTLVWGGFAGVLVYAASREHRKGRDDAPGGE